MLWKKYGTQIKIVFAVMVIALLTGGCKKGDESEAVDSKSKESPPAPGVSSTLSEEGVTQITVDIGPRIVVFNGRAVSFKELDRNMGALAASSEKYVVFLRCTLDSPHGYLIRVLDICHKYKMPPPCVFSM